MDKQRLKNLLSNTNALEDAMKFIYRTSDTNDILPFSNYKTFMRKYNDIALKVFKEVNEEVVFDIYAIFPKSLWILLICYQI